MANIMIAGQVSTDFNVKDHVGRYVAFQIEKTETVLVDVSSWENKPADSLLVEGKLPKSSASVHVWLYDEDSRRIEDRGSVRLFEGPVLRELMSGPSDAIVIGCLIAGTSKAGYSYTALGNASHPDVSAATLNVFAASLATEIG